MTEAPTQNARRVVRNVFWLCLEPALRVAIAIPLAGFVAHKLGVAGYGEFNFALSFAILFGVVANLGLTEVLLRTVSRRPPDLARLWWSVLTVKGLLLLAYLAILLLSALAMGYGHSVLGLILLLALYQGIQSLDNTARGIFMGTQRMREVAALNSGKTAAEVAVTVGVLLLGAGALGLAAARAVLGMVGLVVTVLLTLHVLRIGWSRPSLDVGRSLIGPGLGFAAYNAILTINGRAGILVLERARGVEEVALYAAALALVDRVYTFLPALLDALFPFFSSIDEADTPRLASALGRALRYQGMIAAGLGLGISLVGPWLFRLVFPASFGGAGPVLEALGIAVTLHSFNALLLSVSGARGHERRMSVIAAVQCAVNVGLAFAFAGRFGALGLGWAAIVSEIVAFLLLLMLLSRIVGLRGMGLGRLVIPILTSGLLLLGAFLLPGGRGAALPLILTACYPVLLVVTGALTAQDGKWLLSLIERRAGA